MGVPPVDQPSPGYSNFTHEHEERLAAGRIIAEGRYRIIDELGHGGMAVVYEAEDLQRGEHVALKIVIDKHADRSDAPARYHNEARLAAALANHPNVVHPLEVGRLPELGDRLYLTTELVRGRSLGAVVLEQPRGMAIDRVCRIGRDLARALVALHAHGIVHRDLKPGNVMLEVHDGCERARLLDFGCAYATGDGGVEASADLTQPHERVGSPIYMAPEQALGVRPTPAFDLYAFGATCYELLTGAAPYAGSSKAEVVQRKCALDDPPRPVGRARAGVPPRLAALIDACLARDAAKRPAATQLLEALEAEAEHEPEQEPEPEPEQPGITGERHPVDGQHTERTGSAPESASASTEAPRPHRARGVAAGVLLVTGVAGVAGATVLGLARGDSTEQSRARDDGSIAATPVLPASAEASTSGESAAEDETTAPGQPLPRD